MTVAEQLVLISTRKNTPFLLIGGHAVAAHGFPRQTFDLDLLVDKESRQTWIDILHALGYSLLHDGGAFLQFEPPAGSAPLDLMLVSGSTFGPMLATARELNWGGVVVKVPSLEHLLALKLHSLKGSPARRRVKDMHDVLSLIQVNNVDVKSANFRQLCEKYGNLDIYERIIRIAE